MNAHSSQRTPVQPMQRIIRSVTDRWLTYWFAPESPRNLVHDGVNRPIAQPHPNPPRHQGGNRHTILLVYLRRAVLAICRILFFGLIFLLYFPQDFALWGGVTRALWSPTWLFMAFPLPVFSEPLLNLMQIGWKVALLLSCIGLATRVSTLVAFALGLYLLGLPHNFGKVYHNDALLIFVFGIMMVARSGDAWSVDRWLARRRQGPPAQSTDGPDTVVNTMSMSGEYRWPVRAIWLTMALIFFAAGVAKWRDSGLDWIFSENMRVLLLKQQYGHGALVNWGVWFASSPWLYQPLAAATLLIETGYPLALLSRRARWIFVPAMFLMQVGIRVIMGPEFEQFLICNLFWVPWALLWQRLRQHKRTTIHLTGFKNLSGVPRKII